ncbi:MAG: helix-turn-helix transcriptional regulator [Acidobacteria bacterium]|nr:helix-turn-helix transcriptional regulator [Acidobacteriota bacterium]MBV9068664.1 helix-turn-helix transcriptional regulator [Acidobacteriota bacterium]MBV9185496.1 helix-turn-helix transcriptional regulator [Acidobacteriota bacterium]
MWNARVQEAQLFGRRLRELRQSRDLTQEALAEAADLSGNYISDLELGLKIPSLTIIVRLSQALDIAVSDLLTAFTREAVKKMKVRNHRV